VAGALAASTMVAIVVSLVILFFIFLLLLIVGIFVHCRMKIMTKPGLVNDLKRTEEE